MATSKRTRWLGTVALLYGGLLVCPPGIAGAARGSAIPASARPHGASYAEWSARWWQWAFSTQATATGPFGEGSIQCGVNQPDNHVWFLAGPFNVSGAVNRSCTVPVGTMLLIPVIGVECSNLEGPPFFGATPDERAESVTAEQFAFTNLKVTVDGQQIEGLQRFEVVSSDFAFTGVPGNPTGVEGTGLATDRGINVMIAPLPPGTHTITFVGSIPAFGFTASATYTILVSHRTHQHSSQH